GKQGYHEAADWGKIITDLKINSTAVLLDADGTVGKAYNAKTTPSFVIINPDGKIIYTGAIDNTPSTKSEDIAKAENYVTKVLDAALLKSTTSYGCGVKY